VNNSKLYKRNDDWRQHCYNKHTYLLMTSPHNVVTGQMIFNELSVWWCIHKIRQTIIQQEFSSCISETEYLTIRM